MTRPLAAHDGLRVAVVGACCDLVVVLGVDRIRAHHDDDCPALDPATEVGLRARLLADEAVALLVQNLTGSRTYPVALT